MFTLPSYKRLKASGMKRTAFTKVRFLATKLNAVTGPCGGTTVRYTGVTGVTTCTTAEDGIQKVKTRARPIPFILFIAYINIYIWYSPLPLY